MNSFSHCYNQTSNNRTRKGDGMTKWPHHSSPWRLAMQPGWPQPLHWSSTNWHEVTPAQGLPADLETKWENSYLQNEWIYRRKALDEFNYLLITISEVGRGSLRAITQTQQSKTYVKRRALSPADPRGWQRNSSSNGGCFPWIISVVDQRLSSHHTTETGSVSKSFWRVSFSSDHGGTVQTHCYGSE